LEDARAAALPQSPQVSRWPFPLSCLITTAGYCAKRGQHRWLSSLLPLVKTLIYVDHWPIPLSHCWSLRREAAPT